MSRCTDESMKKRINDSILKFRNPSQLEPTLFKFLFGLRLVRLLDDLPVEEMEGSVGVTRVARVVRDHADGRAARVKLSQKIHHGLAVRGVEVSRRLVG